MTTLRLAYQNLLEQGTVTSSTAAAGYPVQNAFDGVTADFYKPASAGVANIDLTLSGPASANYFAFCGTDLAENGGTIKLQRWNGSAYVDVTTAISPTTSAPYIVFFNSVSASLWRVVMESTPASHIASVAFGTYLQMPYGNYIGFAEPKLARNNKLLNSVSDGGQFLGRSIIRRGAETRLDLAGMSDDFVRSSYEPFLQHAERKPFYLAWDAVAYPNEAAYVWAAGDISPPRHTHFGYMTHQLTVEGLIE